MWSLRIRYICFLGSYARCVIVMRTILSRLYRQRHGAWRMTFPFLLGPDEWDVSGAKISVIICVLSCSVTDILAHLTQLDRRRRLLLTNALDGQVRHRIAGSGCRIWWLYLHAMVPSRIPQAYIHQCVEDWNLCSSSCCRSPVLWLELNVKI